jgi:hypothetical protein
MQLTQGNNYIHKYVAEKANQNKIRHFVNEYIMRKCNMACIKYIWFHNARWHKDSWIENGFDMLLTRMMNS